MRAKGEGTLQRLPSGKWRAVLVKDGRKIAGAACQTKAQARDALKRKLDVGSGADCRSFTTSARSWLQSRRARLSPSTAESYETWLRQIENGPLGPMPVDAIQERHLRQWLAESDLGADQQKRRLGLVRQILRAFGSIADYRPPTPERHSRRPLSPEEAAKVKAEALRSEDLIERLGTLIALEMGLRRSEVCGLRHEDFEDGGVWIRRTVLRLVGQVRVRGKGKTAKSAGWVPIPPSLAEIGLGTGFVLTGTDRPCPPHALTEAVQRVCKRAGVSCPYIGPHALRRTYGMALLEAGVDVVTAAELMRHDPAMLLREYARSRTDLKREAVRRAFGTGLTQDETHGKPNQAECA